MHTNSIFDLYVNEFLNSVGRANNVGSLFWKYGVKKTQS